MQTPPDRSLVSATAVAVLLCILGGAAVAQGDEEQADGWVSSPMALGVSLAGIDPSLPELVGDLDGFRTRITARWGEIESADPHPLGAGRSAYRHLYSVRPGGVEPGRGRGRWRCMRPCWV